MRKRNVERDSFLVNSEEGIGKKSQALPAESPRLGGAEAPPNGPGASQLSVSAKKLRAAAAQMGARIIPRIPHRR